VGTPAIHGYASPSALHEPVVTLFILPAYLIARSHYPAWQPDHFHTYSPPTASYQTILPPSSFLAPSQTVVISHILSCLPPSSPIHRPRLSWTGSSNNSHPLELLCIRNSYCLERDSRICCQATGPPPRTSPAHLWSPSSLLTLTSHP
jgi:hypothetical protein